MELEEEVMLPQERCLLENTGKALRIGPAVHLLQKSPIGRCLFADDGKLLPVFRDNRDFTYLI
jgi:hypothetical protein